MLETYLIMFISLFKKLELVKYAHQYIENGWKYFKKVKNKFFIISDVFGCPTV